MRESQQLGRLRLRSLREQTEARGEHMQAIGERFATLADPASKPRVVQAFNLFNTPEALAARLAGMFSRFGRTLEPSAGLGRLYKAVRAIDQACPITLIEQAPDCCRELYLATEADEQAKLVQGDFLEQDPQRLGLFDSIIANPPYKMWRDIRHISRMRDFLAPGGRLVSLCANGPRQREKLRPIADQWIELPPGSFASEGTQVDVAIVVIDKPKG